ncbi:hypothetical protein AB0N17_42100 [Streptomyces sp. NPDC051133]|uniref:hypothetical protein n=1 Tax=Streptomyces sp. NPDC051133 TaxID=3155521 RepID=UPI0034422DDF
MTEEETKRWRELSKMNRAQLCALYRQLGHVWSARPLEKWTKEEIVSGILEIEFRDQRAEARAHFEDYTSASYGGPHAVDVDQPYGFRVERRDGTEWTFTTGYQTQPEVEDDRPRCSVDVAMRAVTATRYGHSYYGPLRVSVWAHRGDEEHYRNPVPDTAEWFEFGPNTLLEKWRAEQLVKEPQG